MIHTPPSQSMPKGIPRVNINAYGAIKLSRSQMDGSYLPPLAFAALKYIV